MSEFRKEYFTNGESFVNAARLTAQIIEDEKAKPHPCLVKMTALAIIGKMLLEMREYITQDIALALSVTTGSAGEGNNVVFFLGEKDMIDKNNDFLIEAMQKQLLHDKEKGGAQ